MADVVAPNFEKINLRQNFEKQILRQIKNKITPKILSCIFFSLKNLLRQILKKKNVFKPNFEKKTFLTPNLFYKNFFEAKFF